MAAKTLGETIRSGLRALNITQGELAKLVGVDQSHISKLENGGSGVSTEALVAIARVLRLNLDEALIQEQDMTKTKRATRDPRQEVINNPFSPAGLRDFMADDDLIKILKATREELLQLVDTGLPPIVTKDGYIQLFYTLRSIVQHREVERDKNVTPVRHAQA